MSKLRIVFLVTIFCFSKAYTQSLVENSTGSFIFTPEAPLDRPPVEVFYHIPKGDITSMPILMSFHGASRDGANHRDYWIEMANLHEFMVFAPEFTSANYPGLGDNYIMSNIFDDGDNPSPETFNDKNEWTCSILDPLFEYIKKDISSVQEKYSAWGHSAGAQFLHRMFMYLPNTKMDTAVCSNAGWYTVPENEVNYPYGILNGLLPEIDLITAFSQQLIVHLGEDDTIPSTSSGGPRDNSVVNNQQGLSRLERGRYFFNTSQNTANDLSTSFNWKIQEVPNVGHNPQLMANDALKYLLPSLLTVEASEFNAKILLYPNPTSTGYVEIQTPSLEIKKIEIFDVLGKRLKNVLLTSKSLNVSHLKSGLYILKITQNKMITTKKLVVQ